MWTEFVAVEALVRAEAKTREKLKLTLSYLPNERPIVAQLFGNDPHRLGEACKIVKELGFDGYEGIWQLI
jgi:tRNA-dihydrouridine synthase